MNRLEITDASDPNHPDQLRVSIRSEGERDLSVITTEADVRAQLDALHVASQETPPPLEQD